MSTKGILIVKNFERANELIKTKEGEEAIAEIIVALQEVGLILSAKLGEQRFSQAKREIAKETEKLYSKTRTLFSSEGIEWQAFEKVTNVKIDENVSKFLEITDSPPQYVRVATLVFIFFLVVVLLFFIGGIIEGNENVIKEMILANYKETLMQNVNRSLTGKAIGFTSRIWSLFQEKVSGVAETSIDGLDLVQSFERDEPLKALKKGAKLLLRTSQPLESYDLSQYRNATTEQISKENNLWSSVFTVLSVCLLLIVAFIGKEFFMAIKSSFLSSSDTYSKPKPTLSPSRRTSSPKRLSSSPVVRKRSPSPIRSSPSVAPPSPFDDAPYYDESLFSTVPAGTGTVIGRYDPFGNFIAKNFKIGDVNEADFKTIFRNVPDNEAVLVQRMRTKDDKFKLAQNFLKTATLKCSNLTADALFAIYKRAVDDNFKRFPQLEPFKVISSRVTKQELCRKLMSVYEIVE